MSLHQLMAFTVNPDHARQTEVWEALQHSPIGEPYQIRRMLTESAVRASDKRAQFVGLAEYEAAGGIVLRDLFEADDGGWLQDPGLLERLVAGELEREAEAVRAGPAGSLSPGLIGAVTATAAALCLSACEPRQRLPLPR